MRTCDSIEKITLNINNTDSSTSCNFNVCPSQSSFLYEVILNNGAVIKTTIESAINRIILEKGLIKLTK
jgi:hypothetical protein